MVFISESRGDSNRCTSCRGKPNQHATRFSLSVRVWPSTIRISRGPRIATFHEVINRVGQSLLPRKSHTTINSRLLGLLGPYTSMRSVRSILAHGGQIHRSLTDTGGGYNLGGVDFTHTTPQPFQPTVSTFHLRVPPGLQLNHIPPIKPKFKFKEPMTATWSFDHSTIYYGLHQRLAIANNLSLVIGITRIDQKVTLCI
jgi:hypothetical protein